MQNASLLNNTFVYWYCKGPRQPNNIECGYYVLRNMREIIDQRAILVPIEVCVQFMVKYHYT